MTKSDTLLALSTLACVGVLVLVAACDLHRSQERNWKRDRFMAACSIAQPRDWCEALYLAAK